MKINWLKVLPYVVAIAFIGIAVLFFFKWKAEQKTSSRYWGDIASISRTYQDKKGKWTSEVSAKTLTKSEMQTLIDNKDGKLKRLQDIVQNMGLKIKSLESMGSASFSSRDTFYMPFPICFPPGQDSIHHSDGYTTVDMVKVDSGTRVTTSYQDTMTWAVNLYFIEPWRFKNIFVWRDVYAKINTQMSNPKAKIISQEYYRLIGGRRAKRLAR